MFPAASKSLCRVSLLPSRSVLGVRGRAASRLLSTLAVLEQRDGQLKRGSLSAFTAAQKLGGHVHGFVAGTKVTAAAEEAAKVDGVDQVTVVENEIYEKVSPLPSHARRCCPICTCVDARLRGCPKAMPSYLSKTSRRATTRT